VTDRIDPAGIPIHDDDEAIARALGDSERAGAPVTGVTEFTVPASHTWRPPCPIWVQVRPQIGQTMD
jgi:hypothetical protein